MLLPARLCCPVYCTTVLYTVCASVPLQQRSMRLSGELGISRVMKVARIMQRSLHSRSLLFWVRGRKCFQPSVEHS